MAEENMEKFVVDSNQNERSKDKALLVYKIIAMALAGVVLLFGGYFAGKSSAEHKAKKEISKIQDRMEYHNYHNYNYDYGYGNDRVRVLPSPFEEVPYLSERDDGSTLSENDLRSHLYDGELNGKDIAVAP